MPRTPLAEDLVAIYRDALDAAHAGKAVEARLQVSSGAIRAGRRAIALGLGTGIKGPLSGFGDAWQIPLGFLVQYTVSPALGCGASWVFGQLLGGATNPPDPAPAVKGPDLRGVQVWASYTL